MLKYFFSILWIVIYLLGSVSQGSVTYTTPPPSKQKTDEKKDTIPVIVFGKIPIDKEDKSSSSIHSESLITLSVDSIVNSKTMKSLDTRQMTEINMIQDKNSKSLVKNKDFTGKPLRISGDLNTQTLKLWVKKYTLIEEKKEK